jgi:hypothetical protein
MQSRRVQFAETAFDAAQAELVYSRGIDLHVAAALRDRLPATG